MKFKNFFSAFSPNLKLRLIFLFLFLLFLTILEFFSLSTIPLIVKTFLSNSSDLILFDINFQKLFIIFPGKDNITRLIFGTIIIFTIKFFLYLFFFRYEVNFVRDVKSYFSENIFNSYLSRDYLFFLNSNSSIVTRDVINESENASQFVLCCLNLCKEFLLVLVIALVLIMYDPITSMVCIMFLAFFSYLFYLFTHKILHEIAVKRIAGLGALYKIINETFSLIKEIKVSKKENFFYSKFKKSRNYFDQKISERDFIVRLPKAVSEYLSVISLTFLMLYFIYVEKEKDSLFVILSLVVVSIVRLVPSFNQISGSLAHFKSYKESFLILLNETLKFNLSKNSIDNKIKYIEKPNNTEIVFQSVYYDYSLDEKITEKNLTMSLQVIKDVSFVIKKGEFIGVIGKSGSGKSTIINLMLGLLHPKRGSIEINNTPDKIGYVPQDIYLIDDTLKANIALGHEEDEIDLLKINEIIKDCELESFVKNKKKDLNLMLGDKGVKISGGEKQRVSLARTLYNNKNIIIFDEATSSLDNETERSVIESITNIKKKNDSDVTLIMIAHRLSSLKNCDRVILVENGRIKDFDKLENIIKKYPEYENFSI